MPLAIFLKGVETYTNRHTGADYVQQHWTVDANFLHSWLLLHAIWFLDFFLFIHSCPSLATSFLFGHWLPSLFFNYFSVLTTQSESWSGHCLQLACSDCFEIEANFMFYFSQGKIWKIFMFSSGPCRLRGVISCFAENLRLEFEATVHCTQYTVHESQFSRGLCLLLNDSIEGPVNLCEIFLRT